MGLDESGGGFSSSFPSSTYTVYIETDEQDRDTGEFIGETYYHVEAVVVHFDKILMLEFGDGNRYCYNLDHIRSYRVYPKLEDGTLKQSGTSDVDKKIPHFLWDVRK